MGQLPNFVIIGAMRSGTSSLAGYLASHPDLFMALRKELHYFNRYYDRGVDWYKAQFEGATQSAVGEATPTYIYDQQSIDRMAADVPDARVVAILREPVSRAYSHYWFNRSRGHEDLSFADALEAELGRLASADPLQQARYSYVDRGLYATQLAHVADRYPKERLHVLLFEELKREPEATYGAVCEFLGIAGDFRPDNLGAPVNAFYRPRWPKLNQAAKRLPGPLRSAVKLVNRAGAEPYPAIDPAIRQRLSDVFAEPNRELEQFLGREIEAWR